jgi:hypothetical protein
MKWLTSAVALILIAAALRDIFHSVFRPAGQGYLSAALMRAGWRVLRRRKRPRVSGLGLAGPLLLMTVLASWAGILWASWALLYWPRLSQFHPAAGMPPEATRGLVTALYFSAQTLTTWGTGDLVPVTPLARVLCPLEALVGFGLVTSAISWILELYPLIARKRGLASHTCLVIELERRQGKPLWQVAPDVSEQELASLTKQVVDVTAELIQMPASYYFEPRDARYSMAAQMCDLYQHSETARRPDAPTAVRLRAEMLCHAIDELGRAVRDRFLRHGPEDLPGVLAAWRQDHVTEPRRG